MNNVLLILLFSWGYTLFADDNSKPVPAFRVVPIEETKENEDPNNTLVFFATNRLVVKLDKPNLPIWHTMEPPEMFLAATEDPLFGWAVVKYDGSKDVENEANLASYSLTEFTPQYKVQVSNIDYVPFVENTVKDDGMSYLKHIWKNDVLIYFHGFNNNFHTSVLRAAQLKRDLAKKHGFKGSIIVYSWPSMGGKSGMLHYSADESRYWKSLPAVSKFLDAVLLKSGPPETRGKRYVVAHSMGNRVFLNGFGTLYDRMAKEDNVMPEHMLDKVVLAAPDMGIQDFKRMSEFVGGFCPKQDDRKALMYFHASSNIAVGASEFKHLNGRAGRRPVVSDSLITIDAYAAKSPWTEFGHGYYASNDGVVKLIGEFFNDELDEDTNPDLEYIKSEKRFKLK